MLNEFQASHEGLFSSILLHEKDSTLVNFFSNDVYKIMKAIRLIKAHFLTYSKINVQKILTSQFQERSEQTHATRTCISDS